MLKGYKVIREDMTHHGSTYQKGTEYVKDPQNNPEKYRAKSLILEKRHSITSKYIWRKFIKEKGDLGGALIWAAKRGHIEIVELLKGFER